MKKKVTIELPPALHQHLEVFAAQHDLSVARTIRHAIRAHINYVEPAPNIVSTTERPRKLSPAEQAALDAEVDREAREAWLREGNQTTERPRKLSPTKTLEEVRAMWVNDD